MPHHHSIELTLNCEGCGTYCHLRPYLRLTKWGTLRLQTSTPGWYVDGSSVFCDKCAGDRKDRRPQRETWTEWDRFCVECEQQAEADMDALIERNPGVVTRVLDTHRPVCYGF